MLSFILTWKTIGTLLCYFTRVILEGLLHEFRTITRFILDLSFIALVFIVFNVGQTTPPSRYYAYLSEIKKLCVDMDDIKCSAAFLLLVFVFWILAIYLCSKFDSSTSITNTSFFKKSLLFGGSGVISAILFLVGVTTQ